MSVTAARRPEIGLALALDVLLQGPLADAVRVPGAAELIASGVQARVGAVLDALGIASPIVTTVRAGDAAAPPLFWVKLYVDQQRCRFPPSLLSRVAAAIERTHPQHDMPRRDDGWIHPLPAPQRVAALVGMVCAEAAKLAPASLLRGDRVAAYRRQLVDAHPDLPADVLDQAWLGPVLAGVLDAGVSIGDTARVALLLDEAQGSTPLQARESMLAALSRDTVQLFVPAVGELGTGDLRDPGDLIGFLTRNMFEETGVVVPPIELRVTDELADGTFSVRINDLCSLPLRLLAEDEYMVNVAPERLAFDVPDARPTFNPESGLPASIVALESKNSLEGWTTSWNRDWHIMLCLASMLRAVLGTFVHQDRIVGQLEALEPIRPKLVRAARAQMPLPELSAVLRRLADDGIPLVDLPGILERIVDLPWADRAIERTVLLDDPVPTLDVPSAAPTDRLDTAEQFLRTGLRRHIVHRASGGTGTIGVFLLDADLEAVLRSAECGEDDEDAVLAAIQAELDLLSPTAQLPLVLASDPVRPKLRRLLASSLPRVRVLGYTDLPSTVLLHPVIWIAPPS